MAYEPGTFHIGFTEYAVTCWVCGYQDIDYQQTKQQAEKVFRQSGWYKKDGNWCCSSHKRRLTSACTRIATAAVIEDTAPTK